MKFGIEFVPYKPINKIVDLAKKAEDAGIEYCWVTDHYNNRNVYVTLASIATATKKIILGPGATNPFLVHPAAAASSIASIDEMSGGRATFGIAAGDRTVLDSLGIEFKKPIRAINEEIMIIRKLLDGEAVNFEGEFFKLRNTKLNFKPSHRLPIYVGAQGPKLLMFAGKVGDGVLVNASNPIDLGHAVTEIAKGVKIAERKMEVLDIATYTSFSVASSHTKAVEAAKPVVAFIVSSTSEAVLKRHDISVGEVSLVKEELGKGKFDKAAAAVTEKMLDTFSVYGTPAECIKKISELSAMHVTQFVMGSPLGPEPSAAIDIIRNEIMPKFQ